VRLDHAEVQLRHAHVGRVVAGAEDQRLGAVGDLGNLAHVHRTGARLDLHLQPDALGGTQIGLELVEQVLDEPQLAGVLHLGNHQAVDGVVGAADQFDDVVVAVARGRVVDSHHHDLAAVVVAGQCLGDLGAGAALLVGCDGVLQVEKDLVGLAGGGFGHHLGSDPGTARQDRRRRVGRWVAVPTLRK